MKSTFVRKTPKKQPALPPGTKPSIHNGQLLVSTGLHELDDMLGGGLAVGTVLLVEEDIHSSYYLALLKYFVAEGIAVDHAVALATSNRESSFFDKLPKNLTQELAKQEQEIQEKQAAQLEQNASETAKQTQQEEKKPSSFTIAWQYEKYLDNQPKAGSVVHKSGSLKGNTVKAFCHSYDLGKAARSETLKDKIIHKIDLSSVANEQQESTEFNNTFFTNTFKQISSVVNSGFRTDKMDKDGPLNILRIGIHSLGSPDCGFFDSNNPQDVNCREFIKFLHALRGLLRSSLATCLITFPSHLFTSAFVKKVEHLCDTVVAVHSFEGSTEQVSQVFDEYNGQFFIKKLPRLNSLTNHQPETLNYVFKMKRRKLHIEILHLGPEESRSTKEKQKKHASDTSTHKEENKNVSSLLCAPGPPSKSKILDF